tara:strand:+ start:43 stop:483 length:441 start_codon:yes stop_codon:yes gene_type:complete
MAYKQTNNPISRKTSPLRDKGDHPHPHNKPGVISEDKLDLKSGSTSMHDGEKPSPKLVSGDMSFEPHDKDYENYPKPWDGPDYEDPDYKPGMSRKSSPAKFHEPKGAKPGERVSHKSGKTRKEISEEKNKRAKTPHPSNQDKTLKK